MGEKGKDMPPQSLSDWQLIKSFRSGNEAAFEILYERHRNRLYAFLNHLTGNTGDADEVFAETWVRVIDKLDRYRDDGKFSAWLFRVARNIFWDKCRRKTRNGEIHFDEEFAMDEQFGSAKTDPSAVLNSGDIGREINAALQLLTPVQREVFLLRYEEVPFKEIAAIQNCSINTVLSRMQYALNSLRKTLRDVDFGALE